MLDGHYPEDVLPSGCVEVCNYYYTFIRMKNIYFLMYTPSKRTYHVLTKVVCIYIFQKGQKLSLQTI